MDKREWVNVEKIIDRAFEYSSREKQTEYTAYACQNEDQLKAKIIRFLDATE